MTPFFSKFKPLNDLSNDENQIIFNLRAFEFLIVDEIDF